LFITACFATAPAKADSFVVRKILAAASCESDEISVEEPLQISAAWENKQGSHSKTVNLANLPM
jgi:hypothetical protein